MIYCIRCNCISRKLDFADFELADLERAEVRLADIELTDYCHTRITFSVSRLAARRSAHSHTRITLSIKLCTSCSDPACSLP